MWRHCGRCVNPEPTDRGFLPCLLNRIVDTLLPKRVIYRLMVAAQTAFNGCRTRCFNNMRYYTSAAGKCQFLIV